MRRESTGFELPEPPIHSLGLSGEAASISANKLNDLLENEHLARLPGGSV
jgi:hypothetical protein